MEQKHLIWCGALIGLVLLVICLQNQNEDFGLWDSPLMYDRDVPNRNAFRNYYRVGYEQSQNMGWKPETKWNHLQPENNEAPTCFPEEGGRQLPPLFASPGTVSTTTNGIGKTF